MAQKQYTYKRTGVTDAYLSQQVPGTGSGGDLMPTGFQTITWDETYKDDLDWAMSAQGFEYAYEGPSPPAKAIMQSVAAFLAADASSIAVASGWVDVKSGTLSTLGGTAVGCQVTAIGSPTVGVAKARMLVSGGAYSSTLLGAPSYDIPISSQGTTGFHLPPTPIADTTPTLTVYTFTLQMQATGVLGTVVPRAGSGFILVENR